jgi:hypothetical protein
MVDKLSEEHIQQLQTTFMLLDGLDIACHALRV